MSKVLEYPPVQQSPEHEYSESPNHGTDDPECHSIHASTLPEGCCSLSACIQDISGNDFPDQEIAHSENEEIINLAPERDHIAYEINRRHDIGDRQQQKTLDMPAHTPVPKDKPYCQELNIKRAYPDFDPIKHVHDSGLHDTLKRYPLLPALKDIMFNTHGIEDLACHEINEIIDRAGCVVKPGHRRRDLYSQT